MGGNDVPALTRFGTAAAFLDRAERFLLEREAANNLLLGVAAGLVASPALYAPDPYLATVEQDGAVVAAAIRTPPFNLIVGAASTGAGLDLIAADAHAGYGALPGVVGPVPLGRAFANRWRRLSGQRPELSRALRIFALEGVIPVAGVPGSLRPATEADRELLISWSRAFTIEALGEEDEDRIAHGVAVRLDSGTGGFYVWDDEGMPVSLVGYGSPTPHGVRIAPVYTPPRQRNRGYASAAVAASSQRLLDAGHRFCFLFTDLANPTANRIYQAIGYRPVCDVDEFRFHAVEATSGRRQRERS